MNGKMIFIDWRVATKCSFLHCVRFRGTHTLAFKGLDWVPFRWGYHLMIPLAIQLKSWLWNNSMTQLLTLYWKYVVLPTRKLCCYRNMFIQNPNTQTYTHTLIWITCREPTINVCSAYSLLIFFRRKEKVVFAQGLWWNYLRLWGKKSVKQSANSALCWLSAVDFFPFAIKISSVNNQ